MADNAALLPPRAGKGGARGGGSGGGDGGGGGGAIWRLVSWRRWGGWGVSAVFFLFDVGIRLSTDVVNDDLQAYFGIGATDVSSIGAAFFYAYAAMQLPAGTALDYLGPRKTYVLGSLLSATGTLVFGFATSTGACVVGRVLMGAGCSAAWLGAVKVCRTNFGLGGHLSDTMLGVTNALGGVGGLVSQAPFAALVKAFNSSSSGAGGGGGPAAHAGWQGAFKVAAVIPLCTALGAALLIVDHPDEPVHSAARVQVAREVRERGDGAAAAGAAATAAGGESGGAEEADEADYEDAQQQQEQQQPLPPPLPFRRALGKIAASPRMWLFAAFLAGSDSPFEAFAGLWGVQYLQQAVGMTKGKASAYTSVLTTVATLSQLGFGPVDALLPRFRQRTGLLMALSTVGALGFVPFVLGRDSLADGIALLSMLCIGLSVGSATVVWTVISSDPMCGGLANSGLVSGAINTVCIAFDAIVQSLVGVILDANWSEGSYDDDSGTDRLYSPDAYARAFALCLGMMLLSATAATILRVMGLEGG